MLVLLNINSVLNSTGIGYAGALIATIFFGSNYVVTKQVPIGDGIAFQWFMCFGILLTGYACLFISNNAIWVLEGMIGGAFWAVGNAVVPLCIKWVGLGVAFLLWSITNLLTGWCVGKFGLFGVTPEPVPIPWLNDLGPVFGIFAMIVYVFIKPTLKKEDEPKIEAEVVDDENYYDSLDKLKINEGSGEPKKTGFVLNDNLKRIIGAGLALGAGMMYGVCLVPFQKWYDVNVKNSKSEANALEFAISQYSGIFLMSSAIFIVYALVKKNRPVIFAKSAIPAMISGIMWGIAQSAWLCANGTLGMVIGYPIVVVGPMVVNTLWACFLYREIQGRKNFILLALAMGFNFIAVICTAVSNIDFSD